MNLLIVYFLLSVGVSFLCSILESVLLSLRMSYISVLEKERPNVAKLLRSHKLNINTSIASILILNTIANTLGAAAVGAQAYTVFGNEAVVYVSVVLTFAILFLSEIIPKTIGAIHWKKLAPLAAHIIRIFIWITYPVILTTLFVTNRISKGNNNRYFLTREELLESTLLSETGGILDEKESDVIENILQLSKVKVEHILTPRSVVFALNQHLTIKEIIATQNDIFKFSRIPVFDTSIDNVVGIVLTKNIFVQALKDDSATIGSLKKNIFTINKNVPVLKALDLFIAKKDHMFLVTDNYDQTEGIVTLEDCIESILGVEIVDESDEVDDMRAFAKLKMKLKRKNELLESQKARNA